MASPPRIATVIVTYGHAAVVGQTVTALLEQQGPGDEVVVVDNASPDGSAALAAAAGERLRVIEIARNLGFAAGCNLGASRTSAELLLFLNPDARLQPGALDALRAAAEHHPGWGAWQALVTMDGGRRINTAGNVTHYLGFGWAGECGAPACMAGAPDREVHFASGAALVVRREAWRRAGGFDEGYFTYAEDLELSMRLRMLGYGVGVTPSAVVEHDYEFEKGDYKWFLLERNRWRTLLRIYPAELLVLLAPALIALEAVLIVVAMSRGWGRAKLRAVVATVRDAPSLLRARGAIQAERELDTVTFAKTALSARLDSSFMPLGPLQRPIEVAQRGYWRLTLAVLSALARRRRRAS